ncbi:MAG TPA: hypothetical protein DEP03_06575, partial [Massilia sp.]|nr:hypothetical protein [Massilia sp.]
EHVGAKAVYTFRRAVGTKGASVREAALLRLRTAGRLDSGARPAHIITAEQARSPLARQLAKVLEQARRATGPRCLAPSVNQAVLP